MEFENLREAYRSVCKINSKRILFANEGINYSKAWQRAEKRAVFLKKKGYKKGDIIAILAANSVEWCLAYMAITSVGAIALPMDTNLSPAKYREMAKSAGVNAAFVSGQFRDVFKNITVYNIEDEPPAYKSASLKKTDISKDDIASLLFTSGTTGRPKIVALTHGNILHVAIDCTKLEEYTPDDVTLAMLPLYHVYAFEATFLAPLVSGSSIVFLNSLKGPDIVKALAENSITIFPAAPQMWELFFDSLVSKVRVQSKLKYAVFMFFLKAAPALKTLGLGFLPRKIFHPCAQCLRAQDAFFYQRRSSS